MKIMEEKHQGKYREGRQAPKKSSIAYPEIHTHTHTQGYTQRERLMVGKNY